MMGTDRAGFTGVTPGRQRCVSEQRSQIVAQMAPMALSLVVGNIDENVFT